MVIIIVLFSSASRTLHWHIERGKGRTFFLLAWFIQSLIVELIHGIPGGYTHGFGFTALFSGTYRTGGCEVGRRNTGILLGFGSDSLGDSLKDVYLLLEHLG